MAAQNVEGTRRNALCASRSEAALPSHHLRPPRRRLSKCVKQLTAALLLIFVSCLLWLPHAHANEVKPLRFEPRLEGPLLAVGVVGWLLSEQFKPRIAPVVCRTCTVNRLDQAGQRAFLWQTYHRAHAVSDWLLFGVVPTFAIGGSVAIALREGTSRTALVDAMIVLESLVLTANLTQIAKYTVGRARPYVITQREQKRDFIASPDDHLSFFSGHTSSTFALAVSAGMTATLRGYRAAPVMWAVGVPLAALTGYLRIAADRHYLTDVLAGSLVGAAVGVLVPWRHARAAVRPSAAPIVSASAPATLSLTWVR